MSENKNFLLSCIRNPQGTYTHVGRDANGATYTEDIGPDWNPYQNLFLASFPRPQKFGWFICTHDPDDDVRLMVVAFYEDVQVSEPEE